MAKKKTPGLVRRGRIWHFDKTIDGRRIQGSTGTRYLDEAEAVLSHILTTHHRARFYGIRPRRLFREAATRYLQEETKKSLHNDAQALRALDPFIGDLYLERGHRFAFCTLGPGVGIHLPQFVAILAEDHGSSLLRYSHQSMIGHSPHSGLRALQT